MKNENIKVGVAAMLGFGSPATNLIFDQTEPILKLLLLAGQLGVAIVTILFIARKWKNAEKKPAPKPRKSRRKK